MTQTHIPPPQIPSGWYPDPEGKPGERLWDGSGWTEQRRQGFSGGPPPPPPPPPRPPLSPPSPAAASAGSQVFYVERRSNGLAVAGLVSGLVGLVLGLIPILFSIAWAAGITAFVLGIVARRRATRQPEVGRKKIATWAIVLGVLSIGIGIAGYAIVNDAFTELENDLSGDTDEPKSAGGQTSSESQRDSDGDGVIDTDDVSPNDSSVSVPNDLAPVKEPESKPAEPDPAQTTAPAQSAGPEMTSGQENALGAAQNYLGLSGFSKAGLIEQLSSSAGDGFSRADATFAANNADADWNKEAVEAAQNYLDISPMSKDGLIEQLSSPAGDKFTPAQARYAADRVY